MTHHEEANMTGKIDWWTTAGPLTGDKWCRLAGDLWYRPATRAEVEALPPAAACAAVLTCCDGLKVRSSMIPAAGGVTVRLWAGTPHTAIYTVQATEYGEILREVETRLTEIAALAAAGLQDPLDLREALRAG